AQLELATRSERRVLEPLQDPRLDLVFGRESNLAPLDALSRRLSARDLVHTVGDTMDVLFLGGDYVFEAGEAEQWVGIQTIGGLRERLRRTVHGAVVPTIDACAFQQLALYDLYYRAFHPRVVVFAVPGSESDPWLPASARELWERSGHARHAIEPGP